MEEFGEGLREPIDRTLARPVPSSDAINEERQLAHETLTLVRLVLEGGAAPTASEITGLRLVPSDWSMSA